MRIKSTTGVVCAVAVGLCLIAATQNAVAQGVDTTNPNLPPQGVYLTPDQVHAMYTAGALQIVLSAVQHQPFAAQSTRKTGPASDGTGGSADEVEDFPSLMSGQVSVNGSPNQPAQGSGPVEVISYGKAGHVTGTFQTEMLSLNLSGTSPFGPFMIRESPTLHSLGQTTITPTSGGKFHIDSFFDVFTELSIDGGTTWIPSSSSAHVILVPEPSSIVLCGLGLASLGFVVLRRKSK